MRSLKKYIHDINNHFSKKQKIIGLTIICSAGLLGYFGFVMASVNKAELALAELKQSFAEEKICHEACDLRRRQKEQIIIRSLKNKSERTEKRVEKYWRDKNIGRDFKGELLKIAALAYGEDNPPAYIKNYLNDLDSDLALLREIIINFNSSAVNNKILADNLRHILETTGDTETQIEAVKTLQAINNDKEIDNYFMNLVSSSSPEFKIEIIKNISAVKDKRSAFTESQLEIVKKLSLAPDTDIRLRRELLLLAGDYYLLFPEESLAIWREAYNNQSFDAISRSFCADNLNHLAGGGFPFPEVSEADWANYYNQ